MDLIASNSELQFAVADEFFYDAAEDVIYYSPIELTLPRGRVALLHEIAHASLHHFDYTTDFELFMMECRAWQLTRQLCRQHEVVLDDLYITDCLEAYAEWLTERATCLQCHNFSLQDKTGDYRCYRCGNRWRIAEDSLDLTVHEEIQSTTKIPT